MQRWLKTNCGSVLGAILAFIVLLTISPMTTAQQAVPVTGAPVSDPQKAPPKADAVPAQDENDGNGQTTVGDADQQTTAQQASGQQSATSTLPKTDDQKQRLAVNPVTGLTVSSAKNFVPLTSKERLSLYWRQNFFSVGAYFRPVFFALVLDQATGSPSQWGGGFGGFGPRVGSRILSNVVQGTIRAPLAAVLHEDVRYITDHQGGKKRVLHAVEYSFLTYNTQGHPTLNIAKLVGYYASTAISTTWRPGHHDVWDYTLSNGSEQVGLSVPVNILQEFWPDILRKIAHRH